MTEWVASRDLRNDTAGVLRRVQSGERVTITVNGKAVKLPAGVTANGVIRIVSGSDIRA